MADYQPSFHGNGNVYCTVGKQLDEITKTSRAIKGSLTRYILKTRTLKEGESLRRERFGKEDKSKPHKTILMVGETKTGKSAFINAMINNMLGVKREAQIWCEITETKKNQTHSQTKAVMVYDVFIEESLFSLTVIDTPGYGSTEGVEEDLKTTETLHELFRFKDGVHEVDLVCLVASSNTARITDREIYVFDSILSLFGNDIEKNIVLLITRAPKKPTSALLAIKESGVRCAKTNAGEPVCFWFDNTHCEDFLKHKIGDDEEEDEEEEEEATYRKMAWDKNEKNMKKFFSFLRDSKPVSLALTESVLGTRKQLTAAISNLKKTIELTEPWKNEFEQTKADFEKEKKDMNNFKYEVDEVYKEKVPIESKWWHLSKEATCCRECEENCHYPGCWWVRDLSWCSVMSKGKCTVCTGKCDYTKHVKEGKIYKLKTRKVKKTMKDLKEKYEEESEEKMSLMNRLETQMKENELEKTRLVEECYQCVINLEEIALKVVSVSNIQHLDFLIERAKEVRNTEIIERLENLKKQSEAKTESDIHDLTNMGTHLLINEDLQICSENNGN